jgi:hypothetical protein
VAGFCLLPSAQRHASRGGASNDCRREPRKIKMQVCILIRLGKIDARTRGKGRRRCAWIFRISRKPLRARGRRRSQRPAAARDPARGQRRGALGSTHGSTHCGIHGTVYRGAAPPAAMDQRTRSSASPSWARYTAREFRVSDPWKPEW